MDQVTLQSISTELSGLARAAGKALSLMGWFNSDCLMRLIATAYSDSTDAIGDIGTNIRLRLDILGPGLPFQDSMKTEIADLLAATVGGPEHLGIPNGVPRQHFQLCLATNAAIASLRAAVIANADDPGEWDFAKADQFYNRLLSLWPQLSTDWQQRIEDTLGPATPEETYEDEGNTIQFATIDRLAIGIADGRIPLE